MKELSITVEKHEHVIGMNAWCADIKVASYVVTIDEPNGIGGSVTPLATRREVEVFLTGASL